jgi:cullin-5
MEWRLHSENKTGTWIEYSHIYTLSSRSERDINNFFFKLIKINFQICQWKQILRNEDDEALLRTYINVWSKFLDQSNYLPFPFSSMEPTLPKNNSSSYSSNSNSQSNQSQSRKSTENNHVRKLMLDTWSKSIFSEIKYRLQNSAMKIVYQERTGEPFDSQLVIGVRESYGNNF